MLVRERVMSNAPSSSKLSWLERSPSAEPSSPAPPLRPFLPLLPPADDEEERLRSCAAAKQASSPAWAPDAAAEELEDAPGACSPRLNADLRSFCMPRFLAAALLPLLPASAAAAGALGGSAGGCCCGGGGGATTACGRRVAGCPCRSAGCGGGGVGRPRHGLVLLFTTGVWECMATKEGEGQCWWCALSQAAACGLFMAPGAGRVVRARVETSSRRGGGTAARAAT
jgi:hypothetical protein